MDNKDLLELAKTASAEYAGAENRGFALTVLCLFLQDLNGGKFNYKLVKKDE